MYRKQVYFGLLFSWSIVLALSIYAVSVRKKIFDISGLVVRDIVPVADTYLAIILIFSVFVLLFVGAYFLIQHRKR